MSINRGMDKKMWCVYIYMMWYIYTMEYYLAVKKKEIMPFTVKSMDPEIVELSGQS